MLLFRLFNQSTKLPRRITNSQKYDSPIKQLLGRPCGFDVVGFVTNTCLGVMELPIDGNPNREFGVLGNPGGITGAAAGLTKVVTVGPGLISTWKIEPENLTKHRMKGGLGMAPFYALLGLSIGVYQPVNGFVKMKKSSSCCKTCFIFVNLKLRKMFALKFLRFLRIL